MKPKSKNHRLLSFPVIAMYACVTVPMIASATETTITYANPALTTPALDSTAGNANLTISGTFAYVVEAKSKVIAINSTFMTFLILRMFKIANLQTESILTSLRCLARQHIGVKR